MAQPRSGYRQYKNAFVRLPGETQGSLSISPALGNLPDVLSFTYSISDGQLLPAAHQVTPLNVGSDDPLTWTVSAPGAWFTTAPLAGTTPASFWVTPTVLGTNGTAFYTSAVTVTAVSPAGAEGSPHRIDLALRIVDVPLSHIYLPIALHDYTAPPPPPRYPNDPIYSSQWALEKVGAPEAWGYSTGQDVMIAVLDTGADLVHPDLAGKVRTDIDYDFTNGDDEANDDHGHGTHVSGIATAATDNGLGVASLGWEAALLPLKVMDSNGDGDSVDLAQAIYYAADREADVVNMSLGGAVSCPNHVQDAVDYAYARGVVLVAASGNHGGSDPNAEMFPANCEHVLGVAATGRGDSLASYSNYGNHVSVAAPGSEIYSTLVGGGYGHNWGTSMAVPYVAGLAALLRARYPSVKKAIKSSQ
ncbi:MAG: S8 family peptidase [Chloroflexota bacterium]|nr:S8 family peptidase [Chloroflexota bacterium]